MADEFAVVDVAVPSSGTFDITHSDITDWKAAFFIVSGAKTDGTSVTHARMGYGFVESGGSENSYAARQGGGQTIENARTYRSTTSSIIVVDPSTAGTTPVFEAGFSSALSNGVRMTVVTGTDSGFRVKAWLYGGGGSVVVGNATAGTAYTGAGFQADFYIFAAGFGSAPAISNHIRSPLGFACDPSAISQCSVGGQWRFNPGVGTTTAHQIVRNNRAAVSWDQANVRDDLATIDSITSTGFTSTAEGGSHFLHFLGIALEEDRSVKVVVEDLPSGTGSTSFTGLGFKPETCILASSLLTSENDDPAVTTDVAGVFGAGMFTSTEEGAACMSHELGITVPSGPTNANSLCEDASVLLTDDAGNLAVQAAFSSMGSSGPVLSFTQATSGKMVLFGIEGTAPPPIVVDEVVEISESLETILGKLIQVDEVVEISESAPVLVTALGVFPDDTRGFVDSGGMVRGRISGGGLEEGEVHA